MPRMRLLSGATVKSCDTSVSRLNILMRRDGLVGACGFHFEAEGPEFELAYHFKPGHWRRGFATEAAQACVLYAFETLGATKIIAGVKTRNAASLRVLEKLGFKLDRLDGPPNVDEHLFSIRRSSEI
jgi:RimJ/RimL family protein N-acetyltransferase